MITRSPHTKLNYNLHLYTDIYNRISSTTIAIKQPIISDTTTATAIEPPQEPEVITTQLNSTIILCLYTGISTVDSSLCHSV